MRRVTSCESRLLTRFSSEQIVTKILSNNDRGVQYIIDAYVDDQGDISFFRRRIRVTLADAITHVAPSVVGTRCGHSLRALREFDVAGRCEIYPTK